MPARVFQLIWKKTLGRADEDSAQFTGSRERFGQQEAALAVTAAWGKGGMLCDEQDLGHEPAFSACGADNCWETFLKKE